MKQLSLATLLALAVSAPVASAAADDFSLGYDVDRYPATQLSIKACLAALARGAAAVGYTTRAQSDQGTLATHVSGPAGGGRALVSYCISAGDHTAFVVQALDYSGPDSRGPDAINYLGVSDMDDYYAGLVSAGVTIVAPTEDRQYGMRDFRIADPSGNELSIGLAIASET